jgi:hypothetical protein
MEEEPGVEKVNDEIQRWQRRIKQLKKYVEQHGNCSIPSKYEHNQGLANWVTKQRIRYNFLKQGKTSKLTDEQVTELEDIGLSWEAVEPNNVQTKANHVESNNKIEANNNVESNTNKTNVNNEIEIENNVTANNNVEATKIEASNNVEANKIETNAVEKEPNSIQPNDIQPKPNNDRDNKNTNPESLKLRELEDPQNLQEEPEPLKGSEPLKEAEPLKGPSKPWEPSKVHRSLWEKRIRELIDFREQTGHTRVPAQYSLNKPLGYWVNAMRTQYTYRQQGRKSRLSDEQVAELEKVGFVWKAKHLAPPNRTPKRTRTYDGLLGSELWTSRLADLKKYKDMKGNCRVPQLYQENRALATWVKNLRNQYRLRQEGQTTPLTDLRVTELEALGFEWKIGTGRKRDGLTDSEKWKKRVREMRDFHLLHGHCRIPQSDKSLAAWVANQRQQYRHRQIGKKSSLTDQRIADLTAVGFEWKVARGRASHALQDSWRVRYLELAQFRKEHGHCRVPKESNNLQVLYRWVLNQRYQYKLRKEGNRSTLTDDRVNSLEQIGFEWKIRGTFTLPSNEGATDPAFSSSPTSRFPLLPRNAGSLGNNYSPPIPSSPLGCPYCSKVITTDYDDGYWV